MIFFSLFLGLISLLTSVYFYRPGADLKEQFLAIITAMGVGPILPILSLYYMFIMPNSMSPHTKLFLSFFIPMIGVIILCIHRKLNNRFFYKFIFLSFIVILTTNVLVLSLISNLLFLNGHDISQYTYWGKILFDDNHFLFGGYKPHIRTGYYNVILHPPSFPLFQVLFLQLQDVFQLLDSSALMFVSKYFTILIVLLLFTQSGLILTTLFSLTIVFRILLNVTHIDSIRVFLFTLFLVKLFEDLPKRKVDYPIIFFLIGISSFVHSLNFILGLIFINILLFLHYYTFRDHTKVLNLLLIFVTSGPIHYLLEILVGNGWLIGKMSYEM